MTRQSSSSRGGASTGDWSSADDPRVVEACLAGDQAAWTEMVTRYRRLVYSIPRRYGFDDAASEDVFQEVFVILSRRLGTIRVRTGLAKWLITTTHRVCRGVIRRRRAVSGVSLELLDDATPPLDAIAAWERQQLLHTALRRLGGRCERLLTALYLGPVRVRYEAIAEMLDVPVGSIGPTRARCLAKLQREVRELDVDGLLGGEEPVSPPKDDP
jgi:RNA polymerase sigma factor (sigma-70 family)